jgi:hypothetical protein
MVRRVWLVALGAFLVSMPLLATAGNKPVKTTWTLQGPVTFPAGEDIAFFWEEACEFDVRVDYDETIETKTWGDGTTFMFQHGRDVYTNLATGKQFTEKWNLLAKIDPVTGDWDIKGQCEHINQKGKGTLVLDAGRWIWKSDGTRLLIGGPKEFNDPDLPWPPFSYCEFLR